MKKRIQKALGRACVAAILLACFITNGAGDPCWVNYCLIAFGALAGYGAKRMEGRING